MDQPTPPKRKPGRPRKAKPAAGTQTPKDQAPESNPLEATIKAARHAYEPSNQSKGSIVPRGTQDKDKGNAIGTGAGMGDNTGTGAAILPPLPEPRTRGRLISASEYVNLIPEATVVAWATSFATTRNSQRLLADLQPGIGRENQRWRADLVHELERLPLAIETMSQVRSEMVMSDLQRRKLLKEIAHAPEHGLRGYADNLKAIELDAKADPESVENKRKAAESNSLTFNAPVSLFFMPSTQARAIQPGPESKQAEAIDLATDLASSLATKPAAQPLPPVGGTPAD